MKKFLASRGGGGALGGWGAPLAVAPGAALPWWRNFPPPPIDNAQLIASSGAVPTSEPTSRPALRRVRRGFGPSNSPGDGNSSTASITLAFAPASRAANMLWIISIPSSSCSSLSALTPPRCVTSISLGTKSTKSLRKTAGRFFITLRIAARPPSRKARCISAIVAAFSARARAASPPGCPDTPGNHLPGIALGDGVRRGWTWSASLALCPILGMFGTPRASATDPGLTSSLGEPELTAAARSVTSVPPGSSPGAPWIR